MPEQLEQLSTGFGREAHPDRTTVRDLMSPLGVTAYEGDLVAEVAVRLSGPADTVVLVDAAGRAVGVIVATDIERFGRQQAGRWLDRRWFDLGGPDQAWVRPEHPVEGVVWHYRHGPIRPLLVFNGNEAIGVVHPSAVFQWCAEHLPAVLPELSQRAAAQARGASPA
ncbi:hypothetical protein [Citricoccus sp.]|mgnify:CR=1 FL=1|uniref:hypothetical protein n=1 Tax=Citricoccus sp. TaxID=1978372 RepID=UPI00260239EA|nr:hypothetical protein [Citricoccus sp.]HRO31664.1 hypothetical protein [Citricoccus sp.]HRO95154.1 hypothetical protein [Citricoccus sp.]